jgi:hypothetical protein
MFYNAFKLLETQLGTYIESIEGSREEVIMYNVSQVDSPSAADKDLKDKIMLSLVNLEEEATLKNGNHFTRNSFDLRYKNPPVYLNLYVLITAHYEDYTDSLERLSNVVQFFQGKNTFSLKDSPVEELLKKQSAYEDLLIYMDLFSLSFEQLNHLWGSLGGKQYPFLLYKMRLVRIEENRITAFGNLVTQIEIKEKVLIDK